MNKTLKTFLLFSLFFVLHLFADDVFTTTYSFKNVSTNYLHWNSQTKEQTSKESFTYLEYEMGAGFQWGNFYMFADLENPTKSYNTNPSYDQRYVFKPVLDVKIFDNIYIHFQDYNLQSKKFYVSNFVLGLSYKLNTDFGFWIQAFIGPHYQKSTYYSGNNGFMTGWILNYDFRFTTYDFTLTQWHEMTFKRNLADGYANKNGIQGSLALWMHPTTKLTPGIQYRYASHELGENTYQNGVIFSLKYNF